MHADDIHIAMCAFNASSAMSALAFDLSAFIRVYLRQHAFDVTE
jgi:hypothetical protein